MDLSTERPSGSVERPRVEVRVGPEYPRGLWTNANLSEVIAGVNPPLVCSFVCTIITPAFRRLLEMSDDEEVIAAVKGRLYFNALNVKAGLERIAGASFDLSLLFGGSGDEGRALASLSWRARGRLALFVLKALARSFWWRGRFDRLAAGMRDRAELYSRRIARADDSPALLAIIVELFSFLRDLMTVALVGLLYQVSFYFLYLGLCSRWLGKQGNSEAHKLYTSGGSQLQMVRCFVDLWRIGRRLAADPALKAPFLAATDWRESQRVLLDDPGLGDAWRAFLDEHGHRAINELNFSQPRWSEDPSFLLSILKNYLGAPDECDPGLRSTRLAARQAQTLQEAGVSLPRWKTAVLRELLRRGRAGLDARETAKSELVRLIVPGRRACLELGAKLAAGGVLAAAEDVFLLDLEELKTVVASGRCDRAVLEARREMYREYAREEMPDAFGDPESIRKLTLPTPAAGATGAVQAAGSATLKGLAVSHGKARGPARIVLDPGQIARLLPGDILVTDHTDPGWTPVFVTVGAVVTNTGGLLSHAAVVAREYGLPAVTNVRDATERIRDGQMVTVDGDEGTVSLE